MTLQKMDQTKGVPDEKAEEVSHPDEESLHPDEILAYQKEHDELVTKLIELETKGFTKEVQDETKKTEKKRQDIARLLGSRLDRTKLESFLQKSDTSSERSATQGGTVAYGLGRTDTGSRASSAVHSFTSISAQGGMGDPLPPIQGLPTYEQRPSAFTPFRPTPVRPAGAKTPLFGRRPSVKRETSTRPEMSAVDIEKLRQHNLSVETVAKGTERNTSYNHMIEGDLAPVGRVHLVKMGNQVGDQRDNHILAQMDADSNMGAKTLLQRSKRGPFKRSSGRSRIMSRTAHVSYRRRNNALEITVRRGVTSQEMDTLIAKLGAHRLTTRSSFLYLIKGGSKKLVSRLSNVNLEKFRAKIDDCLDKYSSIGLLVQDTFTKGALHKGYSHGMEMTEAMRKNRALFATN